MSATVQCIRCNKTIPTSEAQRTISGFEHCPSCYEEVINPKPKPPTAVAADQSPPRATEAPGVLVVSSDAASRVVLSAVTLTVGDWFTITLKMFFGAFLAGLALGIPLLFIWALLRAN